MKLVRAKGKCLYSFMNLSCLFRSAIPSLHTLHLWSWCCLWNTCTPWRSAAHSILEAWKDRCQQPAGQWQQHYCDQGPGVVTCCISENKIQVTNRLKGCMERSWKDKPFLSVYHIISICNKLLLPFQQRLDNLISSVFFLLHDAHLLLGPD